MQKFSNRLLAVIFISLFSICACTSKDQLKKLLVQNPDILIEAIDKNPEKFAEVLNKVSTLSRQQAQAKQREQERVEREKEFQNPKHPVVEESRVRGNLKAPITIVAYSDFQCPYCRRGYQTIEEIRQKYGDKVAFVFKNFPLPFHPYAMPAAKRFEAIAQQSQEKAYKFHDEVFSHQEQLEQEKEAFLDKAAKKVGANMARMKKDMESPKVNEIITADMNEGKSFGVHGTPAFLINGISVFGSRPIADFDEIIQKLMSGGAGPGPAGMHGPGHPPGRG